MSVKEQLANDLKDAIRQRDDARKNAIRMATWEVKNAEIEKGSELSDGDVLGLISKAVKRGRESIKEFEKAGREDLVAKERAEVGVLEAYLPPQMSREDIVEAAREVISEVGAGGPRDKGKVMPVLIKRLAGRAEGREISDAVNEILAASS